VVRREEKERVSMKEEKRGEIYARSQGEHSLHWEGFGRDSNSLDPTGSTSSKIHNHLKTSYL